MQLSKWDKDVVQEDVFIAIDSNANGMDDGGMAELVKKWRSPVKEMLQTIKRIWQLGC